MNRNSPNSSAWRMVISKQLRAEIKENLEREATQRTRRIVRARALKALIEANDFEVPKSLVEAETTSLRPMPKPLEFAPMMPAGSSGASACHTGLILTEVIRTRGIQTRPARVRTKLEEMAAEYESPATFVQWHYEKPQRLDRSIAGGRGATRSKTARTGEGRR